MWAERRCSGKGGAMPTCVTRVIECLHKVLLKQPLLRTLSNARLSLSLSCLLQV